MSLGLLSATGDNPGRILDTGNVSAKKTYQYELRVWIDYDAGNEVMGTRFRGQLRIEAVQAVNTINPPKMDENMIPVVYNETSSNWEKASNDNWYNYNIGKWANAVTVSSASRSKYQSASVGEVILMSDIETMWVWIPRYSYTIASEDGTNYYGKQGEYLSVAPTQALPGEIDVKFVNQRQKDKGNAQYKVSEGVSGWRTPDAFTFGGEELSGIWVGKFETSSSNPSATYGRGNTKELDAMIKPNVTSWRAMQVATLGEIGVNVVKNNNRYGFSDTLDSHAMKNSEWGAVAYLSQSKYGKLGNRDYSGANKEIYQNKSDQFITGCSYGTPGNSNTDYGCQYTYDIKGPGTGASTTGTTYGIYDMSGGSLEFVMGNYNRGVGGISTANSGYTGLLSDGTTFTGKDWLEDKYYNFYMGDSDTLCTKNDCLSQAFFETEGWYGDVMELVNENRPWVIRGAWYRDQELAGIFYTYHYYGDINQVYSFRLVLH